MLHPNSGQDTTASHSFQLDSSFRVSPVPTRFQTGLNTIKNFSFDASFIQENSQNIIEKKHEDTILLTALTNSYEELISNLKGVVHRKGSKVVQLTIPGKIRLKTQESVVKGYLDGFNTNIKPLKLSEAKLNSTGKGSRATVNTEPSSEGVSSNDNLMFNSILKELKRQSKGDAEHILIKKALEQQQENDSFLSEYEPLKNTVSPKRPLSLTAHRKSTPKSLLEKRLSHAIKGAQNAKVNSSPFKDKDVSRQRPKSEEKHFFPNSPEKNKSGYTSFKNGYIVETQPDTPTRNTRYHSNADKLTQSFQHIQVPKSYSSLKTNPRRQYRNNSASKAKEVSMQRRRRVPSEDLSQTYSVLLGTNKNSDKRGSDINKHEISSSTVYNHRQNKTLTNWSRERLYASAQARTNTSNFMDRSFSPSRMHQDLRIGDPVEQEKERGRIQSIDREKRFKSLMDSSIEVTINRVANKLKKYNVSFTLHPSLTIC